MKKILYIALVALCVAACTPPAVDESKLFLTEAQAEELIAQGECLTIEEFKLPDADKLALEDKWILNEFNALCIRGVQAYGDAVVGVYLW